MIFASLFVIFSLLCSVWAFTRHPIWGAYLYFATTYVYPPGRWWGYIFHDFRWALFAAALTVAAVVASRHKLTPRPPWLTQGPAIILGLYTLWMWIQTTYALDPPEHLRGTIEVTKCMVAMWFVYRVADTKEGIRNLMLAHVLGCFLLGIFAMTIGREGDRLDGVGGPNMDDSNTLGMYFGTAMVCAVALVLSQKGWRRWLSLVALAVIAEGFVLANSRGSFLGLVAGLLVLSVCIARRHRALFFGFCIVGALGAAVVVDKVFIERMFTIGDVTSQSEEADSSARSRRVIAEAQIRMFLDNPMGTGWRGTVVLSPRYLDPRWLAEGNNGEASRSSHNTFLTALTEGGIVGVVIYAALVLWWIGAVLRSRRFSRSDRDPELTTLVAALVGAIAVVFTAGVTADYLTKEVQFWVYGMLMSGFLLCRADDRARHEQVLAARKGLLPGALESPR